MNTIKLLSSFALVALLAACAGTGDKPLTAEGLFDRHVEVSTNGKGMGGIDGVTQHGTFYIDDFGIEAAFTLKSKAPSYMILEGEVMGMQMSQGCNDKECWNIVPGQGSVDMEGEQLDSFRQQADLLQYEHMDQYYDTLEIVESDDPEASAEYKVRAVNKYGRENFYYFSKDTGLLTSYSLTADSPMGVMTQHATIKSYEDFGGYQWPKETEISSSMQSFRIVTNNVTYEPLPDADFVSP